MKKKVFIYTACLFVFFSCKKDIDKVDDPSLSSSSEEHLRIGNDYKANEVLVKFKKEVAEQARNQSFALVNGTVAKHLLTKAMERFGDKDGIYVLRIPGDVPAAVLKLRALANVEYAEPNYAWRHDAALNDPYYVNGNLWGMYGDQSSPANQYGSQASEAWLNGNIGSKRVVVGVIDEGAMYDHEDLKASFPKNPFDKLDGIDNDGNGYVDDVHGWDFYYDDNTTFDGTMDDHGTHVSGTIGAQGGNGKGVIGVSPRVSIFSAKFLGPSVGYTDDAISAVDYMTDLKLRHNLQLVALNNSWGGGAYSQGLKDAIDRAGEANILFIAAAGNYTTNTDNSPYYPGSYSSDNLICVASITSTGAMSWFSNYGAKNVDLGAPGSFIYSTLPGANGTSTYGAYDGTSMATPHVSGACALYAAKHPGATAMEIKEAILSSVIPTPSLNGKCVTGGRLNLSNF